MVLRCAIVGFIVNSFELTLCTDLDTKILEFRMILGVASIGYFLFLQAVKLYDFWYKFICNEYKGSVFSYVCCLFL